MCEEHFPIGWYSVSCFTVFISVPRPLDLSAENCYKHTYGNLVYVRLVENSPPWCSCQTFSYLLWAAGPWYAGTPFHPSVLHQGPYTQAAITGGNKQRIRWSSNWSGVCPKNLRSLLLQSGGWVGTWWWGGWDLWGKVDIKSVWSWIWDWQKVNSLFPFPPLFFGQDLPYFTVLGLQAHIVIKTLQEQTGS